MKTRMVDGDFTMEQNYLRAAVKRYGSVEGAIRILRVYPGFESISRSTLYRWLSRGGKPKEYKLRRALAILGGQETEREPPTSFRRRHIEHLKRIYSQVTELKKELRLVINGMRALEIRTK